MTGGGAIVAVGIGIVGFGVTGFVGDTLGRGVGGGLNFVGVGAAGIVGIGVGVGVGVAAFGATNCKLFPFIVV